MRADKEAVLPLTAVFIGAVTDSCLLYLSPHMSLQRAAQRGLFPPNSHVFAGRESLMVQLWMLLPPGFTSILLLWFYSSLPLSVSLTLYLIEAHRLQDVSWDGGPAAGGRHFAAGRQCLKKQQLINQIQGASWGGGGGDD